MRRWLTWCAIAIGVATGVLTAGALAGGAVATCGPRPCLEDRLPAPLTLTTARFTLLIARDGRVTRTGARDAAGPPGAAVFPATGSWYAFARGHLVVGRGRRTLWRSPGTGWSARRIGVVAAGQRSFAFQYHHALYMGPVSGRVRAVARREAPLGWIGDELYTNSYPRRALLLRGPTGSVLKVLSPLPFHSSPVVADASVYLLRHGNLIRARGGHVRSLGSLVTLGMSADSWLQPVGELLELQDDRHLLILHADGSAFASTALPRRDGEAGSLSESPVTDPSGHAVAFTAAYGESNDPSAAARAHGVETVYLLRAGSRAAVPIHTEKVRFRVCERGASLQWHGSWLLYENSEGNVVLVDTTGAHRAIDLTADIARLAGTGADVRWAGHAVWQRVRAGQPEGSGGV